MISVVRRSMRSAMAPRKAPNSPIGSSRSIVIMATMNGGPGLLIDEHADRDGLHPADREHDEADEPQAPEIRAVDQPGRAAGRPGRSGFVHGRTFLGVLVAILPSDARGAATLLQPPCRWWSMLCRQRRHDGPDPEIAELRRMIEEAQPDRVLHRRGHQHRVGHSRFPQPGRHLDADAADRLLRLPALGRGAARDLAPAVCHRRDDASGRNRTAGIARWRRWSTAARPRR